MLLFQVKMKRLKITFLAICMSLTAYSDDSYKIRWGIGLLSEEIQLQKDDYKLNAGASSISGISSNATHTIMSSLSFFRLLPKGQILGTVCDLLLDRPIDSATVKVKRQRSEDRIQMTDGNGKYIFDKHRLIFGTYTLTVTREGYYPATRTVKLRLTTTQNIALCPLKRNIPANTWKMWSSPAAIPEAASSANGNTIIVGSNLGRIDNIGNLEIRCYRWDANADDDPLYGKYRRPLEIRTGESYWLKSYGAEANLLVGEVVNSTTQTINLASGWNQIANPFTFIVAKNNIKVGTETLNDSSKVSSDLWGWTDTEYSSSLAILPWKGYFLYAHEPCQLTVPPVPCDDSSISVSILNDNYLWSIKLSASSGIYSDRENFIGVAKNGKGDFDPEPPIAMGSYVRLSIGGFASNIREKMEPCNIWEISLLSNETGEPVTLSWSDVSCVPKEYGVYLIDGDNVIDMRKSQQSIVNSQQLKIKVAKGGGLINERLEITEVISYPNPTSGEVTFRSTLLTGGADLKVKIYNIVGQVVKETGLISDKAIDEKAQVCIYTSKFSCLNTTNQRLANGLYFFQIEASQNGKAVSKIGRMVISR